jgi:hypothetical protein
VDLHQVQFLQMFFLFELCQQKVAFAKIIVLACVERRNVEQRLDFVAVSVVRGKTNLHEFSGFPDDEQGALLLL